MSNSCECCKRYWTHLHGKVKCFVRRMNIGSRHSMVIPERFVNHFAWEISGTVKLDAPNGNVYDVEVTKRRSRTILESGWEVFVDDNHIVESDSMMFRYCGSSCFKVVVFDSSGCEKVASCTRVKSTTTSVLEPSTNSTDTASSSLGPSTQSPASGRSQGCRSENSGHCRKRAKTAATSSSSEEAGENASTDSYGRADSHESLGSKNSDRPSKRPYILPSRSHLSQDQIKIIKEKVQAIQSEVPICISIVKKRKHQMEFCGEYAAAHLPRVNQTVVLEFMGKIWETKMVVSNGERWYLCGGWSKFSDDNLLQVGDICLFELKKNVRKLTMMVHLLRKAGEETFSPGHDELGISEKYPNHDDTDKTYDLPYMMPLRARPRLTKEQEKKVLEKVNAIASELPIYVTVMTKSRVLVCLTFATRYSATYLRNGSRSLVLQLEGKSQRWHAELHDVQGALRMCAGWRTFTSDNHLQEGDICLFQLMKIEGPPKMIVYIIRGESSTIYTDMSGSSLCPNTESSASGKSNGCRSEISGHHRKRAKTTATSSSSEESGANASTDSNELADSHESLASENSDRSYKLPYILPSRSCLSQAQMKDIEDKVQAIQSEVPIYICIMKFPISSKYQMELCAEYAAAAHLPRVNQTVVLQFMGKIWEVEMVVTNGGRWYLARGWYRFANDNLLQVGDICLFELKKNERKRTMVVHIIFRKKC